MPSEWEVGGVSMPPVKLVTIRGPQTLPGTPAGALPDSSALSFHHERISTVALICTSPEASSPPLNPKFTAAKG